jgi:hypothetical protein
VSAPRAEAARSRLLSAFCLAVPFAAAVSFLIAKYWRFSRLGTAGGNGMALAMVVIPLSLVLNWGLAVLVLGYSSRRGASRTTSAVQTCVALLCFSLMLFFVEAWRTSHLPTESQQTLADFVRSLM